MPTLIRLYQSWNLSYFFKKHIIPKIKNKLLNHDDDNNNNNNNNDNNNNNYNNNSNNNSNDDDDDASPNYSIKEI